LLLPMSEVGRIGHTSDSTGAGTMSARTVIVLRAAL
jgi:hypothetical protein